MRKACYRDDLMSDTPFTGPPPARVALPSAPLVSVLCQVRFTEIAKIVRKDFIADFQEEIRREYPIQEQSVDRVLELKQDGQAFQAETQEAPRWQFFDIEKIWRITLTTSFITLETKKYQSRQNFVKRLERVLTALKRTIEPTHRTRIGIRYVDRVENDELEKIALFINPQLIGFADSPLWPDIQRSFHEIISAVDEGTLLARWGIIPPNVTHDPEMAPPVSSKSWILDIDVFNNAENNYVPFDAKQIATIADDCAGRCYSFFRWATTTEFLKAYGGEV